MLEKKRVTFGPTDTAVFEINEDDGLLPDFAIYFLVLAADYEGSTLVNRGNVPALPAFIRKEQVFAFVQAKQGNSIILVVFVLGRVVRAGKKGRCKQRPFPIYPERCVSVDR